MIFNFLRTKVQSCEKYWTAAITLVSHDNNFLLKIFFHPLPFSVIHVNNPAPNTHQHWETFRLFSRQKLREHLRNCHEGVYLLFFMPY